MEDQNILPMSLPWQMKAKKHTNNMETLKRQLGKTCTYVSYVHNSNGGYGLKAVINGKKVNMVLSGTPDDVTRDSLADIEKQLMEYVKG